MKVKVAEAKASVTDSVVKTYRINPHDRCSHARDYVEEALGATGFAAVETAPVVLRKDLNVPVEGWVVRAQVPNAR